MREQLLGEMKLIYLYPNELRLLKTQFHIQKWNLLAISFNTYLLIASHVPGTILGTENRALKNIKQGPCPPETYKSLGAALIPEPMLNSMSSKIIFSIS